MLINTEYHRWVAKKKRSTAKMKKNAERQRRVAVIAKKNAEIQALTEQVKAAGLQPVAPTAAEQAILKSNGLKKARKRDGREFFRSGAWLDLRYKVLQKHGARCQCCGASATDGVVIQVDHILPRSKFPELALDVNNLQVLCQPCNRGKLNKDSTDWRR